MTGLDGAVAVVTGAGSGIGRGIAGALHARGAHVVVADLDEAAATVAAAQVDGLAVATDVTDPDAVRTMVDRALDRHGRIDVLVNNAGIGPQAPIADMTPDDWRFLLDVNLWGVLHGVSAVLPLLLAQGSGHIVNVASMSALAPMPPLGGYAVTKAGVAALTEVLEVELAGTGVHTSLVLPGPAILVIPVGLAILATEFLWAKRWLKLPRPAPATCGHSASKVRRFFSSALKPSYRNVRRTRPLCDVPNPMARLMKRR